MDSAFQKPAKILIVDDQPHNLRLLSEILVERGYEVRKAINGSTAFMGLKTFIPDLILLDIHLPEIDGYEICQQLKSDCQTKQIPIIFLSASNEVEFKVKAFEVGGVDYITKPFQVAEVCARVATQIKVGQYNKMREKLSRAIVHDLKNPLSLITFASSSLIQKASLTGKNLTTLKTINASAERLDSMLNDMLMVTKIDAGRLVLHKTSIKLDQLISTTLERFTVATEAKNISLSSQIATVDNEIFADVSLLQRTIENLLSNALKFSTPNSTIKIEVTSQAKSSGTSSTIIKVLDEGIGIKQELKSQIFEPYETGDYIQDVPQIGLGLSFCKMVAEAHGGKISVEDNQPRGTVFIIELP